MSINHLYLVLGYLFVLLGLVGAFLPIVPTTPFLILAAFCFSKSSPKMHQYILNLPHFGQHVRDWEMYGVISKKAKAMSLFILWLCFGMTLYFVPVHLGVKISIVIIGIGVSVFILSRPSVKK